MASDIRIIASMAPRRLLQSIIAGYASATGPTVSLEAVGGVDAARRVREGEAFDLVALASDALEKLEREGHIIAGSLKPFARSPMAMAAPAGAPRYETSEEGVKQALLGARAIGCSTGPSGDHLLTLMRRWGVEITLAPRLVKAAPGVPVAALLARGDVDLGFQQLSELLGEPGIEIVGVLAPSIQSTTIFAVGVGRQATDPEAASALRDHIASQAVEEEVRSHGMEPG